MKLTLSGLSKFDFLGVLFLRIGLGSAIAYHGFPLFVEEREAWEEVGSAMSLLGVPSFHLLWGLASIILQSFGGVAIILGLYTRGMALILATITGISFANMVHSGEPIDSLLIVLQLTLAFIALAFIGPGRLSLDRKGI